MRGIDIKALHNRCKKCGFPELICWASAAFGFGVLLALICPVRFALFLTAVVIIAVGILAVN